jgi:hypothetical protein
VMSKAKVSYRTARRAVQSASLVSDTLADGVIKAYEDEMPITAAVEWFVRNRRCSWSGTHSPRGTYQGSKARSTVEY